ncbi:hypothetical protein PUN28_001605 [Cardiocondyla obscurior]|uniref:Uncharacterized protein n=1 Tax=Cardiocondyla obscurior TaxID=286306 RepID=A0AAW2GQA7_9HYME
MWIVQRKCMSEMHRYSSRDIRSNPFDPSQRSNPILHSPTFSYRLSGPFAHVRSRPCERSNPKNSVCRYMISFLHIQIAKSKMEYFVGERDLSKDISLLVRSRAVVVGFIMTQVAEEISAEWKGQKRSHRKPNTMVIRGESASAY